MFLTYKAWFWNRKINFIIIYKRKKQGENYDLKFGWGALIQSFGQNIYRWSKVNATAGPCSFLSTFEHIDHKVLSPSFRMKFQLKTLVDYCMKLPCLWVCWSSFQFIVIDHRSASAASTRRLFNFTSTSLVSFSLPRFSLLPYQYSITLFHRENAGIICGDIHVYSWLYLK